MPDLYVARSRGLEKWGAEVGLTKHVFKVGLAESGAEAAVKALNESSAAGHADWKLVAKKTVEALDENAAFERIAKRERLVDPNYYPGIKGARGIFKVKPGNSETHLLLKQAIGAGEMKNVKITPEVIADYLLSIATG